MNFIDQLSAVGIDGETQALSRYQGQVRLIVNVASHCGFTKQYAELQALYERYRADGFVVLGFPCNQFGWQEPGDNAEIAKFCDLHYQVTFPLFAKIDVNGPQAHPLFAFLQQQKRGFLGRRSIAWNFTKFLVDGDGQVVGRYSSRKTTRQYEPDIRRLLGL